MAYPPVERHAGGPPTGRTISPSAATIGLRKTRYGKDILAPQVGNFSFQIKYLRRNMAARIEQPSRPAIRRTRSREPFPRMDLVSIPANPAPPDAVVGALKTPDGVNLRYVRWAPPPGRKGTVCVFQGRGECAEKYFESVRDLRARGFAVATLDWRG